MMRARRVLVVQMCRMGDILQTGPTLRGLRREHPDAEIVLVLLDSFAATPIPSHLYDRLVVFPMDPLYNGLAAGRDWRPQLARLEAFIAELGEAPFDLAVNLTQTPLSALLMAIVPARDRRGPFMAGNRQMIVLGAWAQQFWSNARARGMGSFNLVDLFAWTAGVGCDGGGLEIEVPREAETRMDAWLADRGLASAPIVAVQLGASEEAKRWPAEQFAAACDLLPAECGEVLLVGSAGERPLAERFRAASRRVVHEAVGSTSLTELAAVLRRCRLLISNDTGTMHVAAAVGTPVVCICSGSVFVHETGPYGEGHVVLEPEMDCFPCAAGAKCHHYACRDQMTPVDVAAAARFALGDGAAPRPAKARVLTGRRTALGRIEYWPLHPERVTAADIVRACVARVWEESLPAPRSTPGAGSAATADVKVEIGPNVFDALRRHAAGAEAVAGAATRAASLLKALPAASRRGQGGLTQQACEEAQRVITLAGVDKVFQPFVDYLLIEGQSASPVELHALVRVQAAAYKGAAHRARRLGQLLLDSVTPTDRHAEPLAGR